MTRAHSLVLYRCGCTVALCLAWGGCAGPEVGDALAERKPLMPTVNPPPPAPALAAPFEEIMREARNQNVPGMIAATERVGDFEERARLAVRVTEATAQNDLPLATRFATTLPPGRALETSIVALVHRLARGGETDPLRWAQALSDPVVAVVARRAAVEELVRANPRAAIERVLALPESREREDMLQIAAAEWARRDAAAAVEWVRALPENDRKRRLGSTVVFEVAQADPARAVALAETLPEGRDRWLLLSAIGQTWVARDQNAAMAWASHLPAGEPRDAAFSGIDTGMGIPVQRRVVAMADAGASGTRGSVRTAMSGLEASSPDFAVWLAAQPAGMSNDQAILEYVRQRGALQPWAVGPWLTSLPGGQAREQAMEIFVDGLLLSSPADAARWISVLPRSDRSTEMIEKTARRWLLTNPSAAEMWLRDTPLTPDRKELLLREAGK